jgi:putative polyhydroxyalkanoate system protein
MTKSIIVTLPHDLGAEKARQRIATQLEQLREAYIDKLAESEIAWSGDHADLRVVAMGQTATGQLDIAPDSVRIEVQLPWILAALSGRIEGLLKESGKDMLQIGHMPKK